jgi:acyl carrier protein
VLGTANTLNRFRSTVTEIMGVDSLELVELVLAIERQGTKENTVDDFVRFMDQM